MASELTGPELWELDQHLMRELGVSLDSLQVKRLEKITALRTKRAVTTDAQFRLVYGRHEQIVGRSGPRTRSNGAEGIDGRV